MTAQTLPGAPAEVDVESLCDDLRARVDGEVRSDPGSRAAYSTDGSNYRFPPIAVVVPNSVDAGAAAVRVCAEHGAPVLSRGGGTSLAGQTTNAAVVLDWTKRCHHLVSVDQEARTCIVEPGIVLDVLNDKLAEHSLMFGPRPSTHWSCVLGGMIGNNSCGATAQAYGKTVDNIRRLEVLTYDGLRMWVGQTSDEELEAITAEGGRRAEIYASLRELRDRNLSGIRTGFPKIPRRVSGYNLDSLLPENGFHVARALVGSEGTLVTVLHAELELVPVPAARDLVVLGYPDIFAAADAVPSILESDPHRLEGLDDILIGEERSEHLHPDAIEQLPKGSGWLMVEFVADDIDAAHAKSEELVDRLKQTEHEPAYSYFDEPEAEDQLWQVREGGLGATARPPGGGETWEGWEDAAVSPYALGGYLRDFHALLEEYDYADESALYGHFGQGCVHTRIPFDMRTASGVADFRSFVERAADLVVSYGGSLSGEHGDGQARGALLAKMYPPEIMAAFGDLKAIFDPDRHMNPGRVVWAYPVDTHLRLGTDFEQRRERTWFAYPEDDHSFGNAVMRCIGVGKCRNHGDGGVMCPSYRVTGEEEHTTRGRSRLLQEMMRVDGVVRDSWRSKDVLEALDLCLACKGCKKDCPVNVDMATYKAEFLAHHYRGRLRPMAHYTMGWLPLLARLASAAPGAVNALMATPGLSQALKKAGGVAPERAAPRFARQRFVEWFAARPAPARPSSQGDVVLWPDSFNNNFSPEVGRAAVEVLESAGFRVRIPSKTLCCGLTWISTGQLATARRVLQRTVAALRDDIRAGTTVVGLEPSCTAVFRSDAAELFPHDDDVLRLQGQVRTLAEVLEGCDDWRPPSPVAGRRVVVQPHCHQHAIMGFETDRRLMERLGIEVVEQVPGCCGLAGNFGFEDGHYDISMKIAEDSLLPAIRNAHGATTLADGFSCRTQVAQSGVDTRPLHLAQLLAGRGS